MSDNALKFRPILSCVILVPKFFTKNYRFKFLFKGVYSGNPLEVAD